MATSAEPLPQSALSSAIHVAESLAKLRLAHEAAMVQDAQQVLSLNRQAVAAHQKEFLGVTPPEGSDVIHIGDVNHPAPVAPPATAAPSTTSTLAKVLTALAISGPIGAGIAYVGSKVTQGPSEPATASPPVETTPTVPAPSSPTLYYDLRLGRPK